MYLRVPVIEAVAPHAGAWIEIRSGGACWRIIRRSLPMRERGLKSHEPCACGGRDQSLPMRERGLKSAGVPAVSEDARSLPMRERGLKLPVCCLRMLDSSVAPHAGAWIEIEHAKAGRWTGLVSLPMRERGLKSITCTVFLAKPEVAPHAGAWIEIPYPTLHEGMEGKVAPHAGAWIEIYRHTEWPHGTRVSLPMRERGLKYPAGRR